MPTSHSATSPIRLGQSSTTRPCPPRALHWQPPMQWRGSSPPIHSCGGRWMQPTEPATTAFHSAVLVNKLVRAWHTELPTPVFVQKQLLGQQASVTNHHYLPTKPLSTAGAGSRQQESLAWAISQWAGTAMEARDIGRQNSCVSGELSTKCRIHRPTAPKAHRRWKRNTVLTAAVENPMAGNWTWRRRRLHASTLHRSKTTTSWWQPFPAATP